MNKIKGPDGTEFQILDVETLDFSHAGRGYKSAQTLIRVAQGGELIETKDSDGNVESVYTTKAGDIIFMNLHNPDDIYVPRDKENKAWTMEELQNRGYEIVGEDQENGGLRVVNKSEFPILKGIVSGPMCILNAWGEGNHQFLYKGAVLKLDEASSKVSGISAEAFEKTWTVTKEQQPKKDALKRGGFSASGVPLIPKK